MDALQLLKADHKTVNAMLEELAESTSRAVKKRTTLLQKIRTELLAHAQIEEEIFYPAFKEAGKKADDAALYFEALEEHRAASELVLPDLLKTDPASEKFSGRAKVLKEMVEHHAEEEEKEMFPRARKLLSKEQLRELGLAMEARKKQLVR